MVNEVMQDPELALETHAREELGITTQNLGSPWQAAAASFVTFAVGAFIPLAPWLFTSGTLAIVLSVVLGAVASLAVGAVLAKFTERPAIVLRAAPAGRDRGRRRGHLRGRPRHRDRHELTRARERRQAGPVPGGSRRYDRSTWSTVKPSDLYRATATSLVASV